MRRRGRCRWRLSGVGEARLFFREWDWGVVMGLLMGVARVGVASGMRRWVGRGVSGLCVAVVLVGVGVGGAWAQQGDRIADYRVEYSLRPDGEVWARETVDYVFGGGKDRHGIFMDWTVRRNLPESPGHFREYEMSIVNVTSPTGASTVYEKRDRGGVLRLQIGDKKRSVSGRQRYVVEYRVKGVVNRIPGKDGAADTQELFLNPVATHWEAPIDQATVTVTGPVGSERRECWVGEEGSRDKSGCVGESVGGTDTFTATGLGMQGEKHLGMTVVTGYQGGTVSNDQPIIREGDAEGGRALTEFVPQWVATAMGAGSVGVGGLAFVGAVVGMGAAYRRRGRDEQFVGLTPGVLPGGEDAATEAVRLSASAPVAVRFEPPQDSLPGLIGTLQDESADMVDVTASIVDLAVRGVVVIEEVPRQGKDSDWRIRRGENFDEGQLLRYERTLVQALLGSSETALLSSRRRQMATRVDLVKSYMYDEVTAHGWFRQNPKQTRSAWAGLGVILLIAGAVLAAPLLFMSGTVALTGAQFGMFLCAGAGVAAAGVVVLLMARSMVARTAAGTAVLHQARGFKEYLVTAEAGQIRFEEAEKVFSRYLPYAIVFGVAEKWAKIFDEVVAAAKAEGAVVDSPSWYSGGATAWDYVVFTSMLRDFSGSAESAFSAPIDSGSGGGSAGASGQSGFGGGGSVGGGGFGGGGGGSW